MVLDYVSVGLVREDAVCPYCGSDLVIRFAGDLIIVQCVDCDFSQVDVPAYTLRRRSSSFTESRQASFSLV